MARPPCGNPMAVGIGSRSRAASSSRGDASVALKSRRAMEPKEVFDELKTILVTRLKFDPRRAVDLTLETALPKGIESSIGLDSLDFIELAIAIEERFGITMDESADLAPHFTSFDTLSRYIASRTAGA
ncbi:MAG: hypothetical protein DMD96_17600 [Candidatus Rokuibacteriota bacterium]|nr:MAG: hypothetical protein DMD96_17600 [Candidatus Rokubacteria bacterium]